MTTPSLRITRRWFVLAGKLFGITAVSALCLFYLSRSIAYTASAIEEARSQLAAFHAKYDRLEQLKKDKERIEPYLTRLEEAIPAVDNFPVISDYINAVATKTSNTLTARFDPIPQLNETGLRELSFSLQTQGSLSTIEAFLAELERAPYFVDARNVSVTLTTGLQGQATADLAGVIYLKDTSL